MKITVKATNLDLTPSLKTYVQDKLGSLGRFLKKFDEEGAIEMWFEVARTTRHHKQGLVFEAEADLRLPGKVLRAVHDDVDARAAIDGLRAKLRMEIEKYKTKVSVKPRKKNTF